MNEPLSEFKKAPKELSDREYILSRSIPEPNTGCWFWLGSSTKQGYGMMGRRSKRWTAHRFSFKAFIREPSPGLQICHKCDNASCVRPDHLYEGTASNNQVDTVIRGRRPRGITKAQVKEMHALETKGMTRYRIAKVLGLNKSTVFQRMRNPENYLLKP